MHLHIHQFDLRLKHAFTTSHESRTVQPSMIIQLGYENQYGLGEAVATAYYGYKIEDMIDEVEARRQDIEAYNEFISPDAFYLQLQQWFPQNSFIRCAFDIASNDLYGKLKNKPLYKLWGTTLENIPVSNFTIGMDSLEMMKQKLIEQPWPIYKIKLGMNNDIELMEQLRAMTDAVFRVDANCGWTVDETIQKSKRLADLGVEFIEQPLPASQLSEMVIVQQTSVLPFMADENCMVEEDVAKCAPFFDIVNIKLTKCGGLTPARRMIQQAKKLGLKTMVGCMTESSVGISAIAHLLPQLDYVDMDGAILLAEDPAVGVSLGDDGKAIFPNRAGTGALLKKSM